MNLFSENDVLIINQILFFNLKPPLIIMVYFLREVSVWKLRFYGRMMLTLTCGVILTQNSCWWPTEDKHTEPWLGRLVTSRWAENEERGTMTDCTKIIFAGKPNATQRMRQPSVSTRGSYFSTSSTSPVYFFELILGHYYMIF